MNDDLRYIDYSQAVAGSPRVLTSADLPILGSGRYHFARKFDLAVDREVLDRIDRELLSTATGSTLPRTGGLGAHALAWSVGRGGQRVVGSAIIWSVTCPLPAHGF